MRTFLTVLRGRFSKHNDDMNNVSTTMAPRYRSHGRLNSFCPSVPDSARANNACDAKMVQNVRIEVSRLVVHGLDGHEIYVVREFTSTTFSATQKCRGGVWTFRTTVFADMLLAGA